MQPTASAQMHKVAKLIVSFKRLTASSDKAMILDLSTLTFSKDISEQDWPSAVENELIDNSSCKISLILEINNKEVKKFEPFITRLEKNDFDGILD